MCLRSNSDMTESIDQASVRAWGGRAASSRRPSGRYSISSFPLAAAPRPQGRPPRPVRADRLAIENGIVRVSADSRGRVSGRFVDDDRQIEDLLVIEDSVDRGDLYTPSIRGAGASLEFLGAQVIHPGPLLG